MAKVSKTDSITKIQTQFALQGLEDHYQYKRLEYIGWKASLITRRNYPRNYDFYMCAHAGIIGSNTKGNITNKGSEAVGRRCQ